VFAFSNDSLATDATLNQQFTEFIRNVGNIFVPLIMVVIKLMLPLLAASNKRRPERSLVRNLVQVF
jgi:predicted permease